MTIWLPQPGIWRWEAAYLGKHVMDKYDFADFLINPQDQPVALIECFLGNPKRIYGEAIGPTGIKYQWRVTDGSVLRLRTWAEARAGMRPAGNRSMHGHSKGPGAGDKASIKDKPD